VLKAFRILEFISAHRSVKPSDITRCLGLSRTNVHRLLATLMHIGYVTRDNDRGYRLSFEVFKLGSRVPLSRDLRDVARPVMADLMRTANENVYLTVLYGHMVIAIEEVKSANPLSLNPDVTYSYPVHACASGKNFLSVMDETTRERLLRETGLTRRTERTITDIETMHRECERCREQGYATELAEFSDDLNSYAAPIFDYRGKMVANVSISGPALRATRERLDSLVDALREAADSISQQLGKMDDHE
jgi:IclR family acetate operon transcriptional repressor